MIKASNVYRSLKECLEAQNRGGIFKHHHAANLSPIKLVFNEPIDSYLYLLGSDPQEPKPARKSTPRLHAEIIKAWADGAES
jgi:hypothetical protein